MGLLQRLTTAIGGAVSGTAPEGNHTHELHPIITGKFINWQARIMPGWAAELTYQRPQGKVPNPAPAGLQFKGRMTGKVVPPSDRGFYPVVAAPPTEGPYIEGAPRG